MLQVNNLNIFYGRIQALWDICLSIDEGEIVAIVGANGAGKSTLVHAISGLLHPTSGTIIFQGQRIDGLTPNKIVELGISHIPEGRRLFTEMSIRENLEMGAYSSGSWKVRGETLKQVYEIFPVLKEREKQLATTLSGGEQQMLAMGRGLMSSAKILMLDEPTLGLAPLLAKKLMEKIHEISNSGVTIIIKIG